MLKAIVLEQPSFDNFENQQCVNEKLEFHAGENQPKRKSDAAATSPDFWQFASIGMIHSFWTEPAVSVHGHEKTKFWLIFTTSR